jgi:secreted Zn-dependent insulinase-like peptidase
VKQNGKELALPVPNTLLPTKFDILPEQKDLSAKANLLQKWDNTELWYKKDDSTGDQRASSR